ncbi:MAG: hybrid sensor histidine kinase/response regulator [Rubrivivax sp.]|nr:MAG: hybrid sensor histidine kinase/response regulator [Rubrivivax sp.]
MHLDPDMTDLVPQSATSSMRASLAFLAMACILPGALMSTYFIVADYQRQKEQAVQDAVATARSAAANLDRDLASIESGLRVLATSSALEAQDLSAFYRQAHHALPFQNITNYVLVDPEGRQRLNTIRPLGTPLPEGGAPPELRRVLTANTTVLTDLFTGPATGKPTLAMGVPVLRQGKPLYGLNAGIFPERVLAVLKTQRLPPNWIGAVLDGQGTLIARTHDMNRFLGRPAVPDLVRQAHENREGVLETTSLEGIPLITAFSRSSMSNWTVAIGIPKASLTAGLKQSLTLLLAANALVSALALWFAWRMALSAVVTPTDRLLQRMARISRGVDPGPPDTAVTSREFVTLDQGLTDMGQRLLMHEQARRAKASAEAANQAKTDFLSRMSHELRTPLNAVLGFAQVLKLNPADPLSPRQLAMVNQIESSGHHLLKMIADVLDVSKIESSEIDVRLEDLDVRSLTLACHQMIEAQAGAAGVRLNLRLPESQTLVRADETRLKQVLLNLLSNAVKYNQRGGSVTLTVQPLDGQVSFAVSDTGMGMNAEQVRHLFEPFNRLGRENTATPGTGIGLVICQRLLALMDSKLTVTSTEHEGSEFRFLLPAAQAHSRSTSLA